MLKLISNKKIQTKAMTHHFISTYWGKKNRKLDSFESWQGCGNLGCAPLVQRQTDHSKDWLCLLTVSISTSYESIILIPNNFS